MADIALADATKGISIVGMDGLVTRGHIPLLADCAHGAVLRIDPTTGRLTPSRATTAPNGRIYGIAEKSKKAGYGVNVIRAGILAGWDFTALNFDDPVYLSDTAGGVLSTTAGTVSIVLGRIIPGTSTPLGSTYDKLLELLPVY